MNQKSTLFAKEPQWFDARQAFSRAIPKPVNSWLFEPGSLTQRLRAECGEAFQVRLLKQRWQNPFLSESRQLEIPAYRYALTREVVLCCGEVPLVCARTIIPEETLHGAQRRLSNLGTRPLGEVLFSSPKLERNGFELANISPNIWRRDSSCFAQKQEYPTESIWGRRTVYSISSHDLLVSEIFMPTLFVHRGMKGR